MDSAHWMCWMCAPNTVHTNTTQQGWCSLCPCVTRQEVTLHVPPYNRSTAEWGNPQAHTTLTYNVPWEHCRYIYFSMLSRLIHPSKFHTGLGIPPTPTLIPSPLSRGVYVHLDKWVWTYPKALTVQWAVQVIGIHICIYVCMYVCMYFQSVCTRHMRIYVSQPQGHTTNSHKQLTS